MHHLRLFLALALPLVALDQALRAWVVHHLAVSETHIVLPQFLALTHALVSGGPYHFLGDWPYANVLFGNLLIALLWVLWRSRHAAMFSRSGPCVARALLVAGAASSLLDRLFRGCEIDYLVLNLRFTEVVFKLSDTCLLAGFVLLVPALLHQFWHRATRSVA